MYQHLRCVALRTIKYDDRRNIVAAWSAECGRVGLIVSAGNSREASRRRALMMPLGLFEGEVEIRPGFELLNIRDVRPMAVLPSIAGTPAKSVVAMFLAEVLERLLRESPPDAALSDFIFDSVRLLDTLSPRGTANFPLVFLCRLGALMGVEPDPSEWAPGKVFDMVDGVYRASFPSKRWLDPEEAAIAHMVQRLTYATASRLAIPRRARQKILDTMLEYLSLHTVPLDSLKTLPILRDLL